MALFYVPDIAEGWELSEEEAAHCLRVLRLSAGDELEITDGKGNLYKAEIASIQGKHCYVQAREVLSVPKSWRGNIHIAIAPTKNIDRIEWFVEKATECGIDRIVPILCDHSERKVIKGERLEKIAVSAMKQSLKAYLPQIDPLTPLRQLLAEPFDGVKLIAHCEEDAERIFMGEKIHRGENVLVLIGPEGDFSREEIEAARKAGFVEVSLGNSRLRTETAALAAAMFTAFVNS